MIFSEDFFAEYNRKTECTFIPPKLNPRAGIKFPNTMEEWQRCNNYFKSVFNEQTSEREKM